MDVYAGPMATMLAPNHNLPKKGLPASAAEQMITDELKLDGNTAQNLATFVTTYMEPEAERLMTIGSKINFIDADEYPQSTGIQQRCVNMIGKLWNGIPDKNGDMCGTACVGSSEAIMLSMLAFKFQWRERRKAAGLPYDKPNAVFGSNVQVCWHKACLYFDIECREADVSEENLVLMPDRVEPLVDENTICVAAILGSTFTGDFEDCEGIHSVLVEINKKHPTWKLPMHIDAASGGFIAPFMNKGLVWDFRLPLVKSINASGHKFGLVYAGLGWLMFRDKAALPDELVTHVNYLGGDQSSFTLNFSKPASNILAQYYTFLRLGAEGYTKILKNGMSNSQYLRDCLTGTGEIEIVDKGHMPLVAFKLIDPVKSCCTLFDLQDALKSRGWTLPAYRCSKGAENLVIMRAVVKQNFTRNLANLLAVDIKHALAYFKTHPAHLHSESNAEKKQTIQHAQKKRKISEVESVEIDNVHTASEHAHSDLLRGNKKHILSRKKTQGIC